MLVEDKFMRVLLMFDIPVKTKKEQQDAARFRNALIKLGYFMMQFSVYMRICKGVSSARSSIDNVKKILPPRGNVRVLIITEKQFDAMELLLGKQSFNEEINNDKNLTLFSFDEKTGDYCYKEDKDKESKNKTESKKEAQTRKPKQPNLFEF